MSQPDDINPYEAPNPYEQPAYPPSSFGPPQSQDTTLAITSLVLGIGSIMASCCCALLSLPLSLGAIVTGYLALQKVKNGTGGGRGMAMAGLICGIASLLLVLLAIVFGVTAEIMKNLD